MNSAREAIKLRVAVLFGGRSVEHEISVITGTEIVKALDPERFEIIPVYVAPSGRWYTGAELLSVDFYKKLSENCRKISEVSLLPLPGVGGLAVLSNAKLLPSTRKKDSLEILPVDVFFPAFHGEFGEDGCIQGLFELADVAYTGCGVFSSAVSMNKHVSKRLLKEAGLPVLPGVMLEKRDLLEGEVEEVLDRITSDDGLTEFPLFVKPNHLGSSVGVGVAQNRKELLEKLVYAFRFDTSALIEPCLEDKFELNVSVKNGDTVEASVVEMPVATSTTLTYEDKYLRGGKSEKSARGMASLVRAVDPQDLPTDLKAEVRKLSVHAYKLLACSGVVRFDFMVDSKSNQVYFNELNSLPGSLSYYLWAESQPQQIYTELLNTVIEAAIQSKISRVVLERDVGFNALFR